MYLLDLCPLWLVKAGNEGIWGSLVDVINVSRVMGVYAEDLKEAVVVPLFIPGFYWSYQLPSTLMQSSAAFF